MKMKNNALIILVRNPILGKVKTRLAGDIGEKNALKIYKILLNYTKSVVCEVNCSRLIFYTDLIEENDIWDYHQFQKFKQEGSEFGERMLNAFKIALKTHNKAMIIGSDCYEITPEILEEGFKKLDYNDIVIGPAEDGGYYLLGMKKIFPRFFNDKKWSSEHVLEETLNDFKTLNLSYYLLPKLRDIDDIEDLRESGLDRKVNLEEIN